MKNVRGEEMLFLGRKYYYENGSPKFEAWFEAQLNNETIEKEVERTSILNGMDYRYQEMVRCFEYKGKLYTERGIRHFNGHISGFTDKSAIFGVYLREVK